VVALLDGERVSVGGRGLGVEMLEHIEEVRPRVRRLPLGLGLDPEVHGVQFSACILDRREADLTDERFVQHLRPRGGDLLTRRYQ
jgi:hypothetical protein